MLLWRNNEKAALFALPGLQVSMSLVDVIACFKGVGSRMQF